MSKIIVDQIQKNGGDVLTLPTTDATANNQPLVGSTSGVLSHSPLSLPAADGSANRPVTTNGSAQLQFGSFSLPTTTGILGQNLGSDGAGGTSWVGAPENLPPHTNSDKIIGCVVTSTGQANSYSGGSWSSSAAWTTYNHSEMFSNSTYAIQGWNMFLGDGYPEGTSQIMYADNTALDHQRQPQYAINRRMGHIWRDNYYSDNSSSYGGLTWRCMPIRNSSTSSKTVAVYGYASSYTTYSSCSMGYYTPTGTGALYSEVTGGSWTQIASTQSSNVTYGMSGNITIPAKTTILVFINSAKAYQTTYRFSDTNMFYNLHSTFSDTDVHCDLRMVRTLAEGRCTHAGYTTASTHHMYNHCADLYGDR
jgi:hypothetical protein